MRAVPNERVLAKDDVVALPRFRDVELQPARLDPAVADAVNYRRLRHAPGPRAVAG